MRFSTYYLLILSLLLCTVVLQTFYSSEQTIAEAPTPREILLGGDTVGVRINYEGILIVGFNDITTQHKKFTSPAKRVGLRKDDIILSANNIPINYTADLTNIIKSCEGRNIQLTVLRGETEHNYIITPEQGDDGYKVGIWVRDNAAGIGTVTFYDPQTGKYAALGHGVTDVDTGKMIDISEGQIMHSVIVGIDKGERGSPGQLKGVFDENESVGVISFNSEYGIYGTVDNKIIMDNAKRTIQTAAAEEIQTGDAYIMCNIDNEGVKQYKIEIQKLLPKANDTNKSMIIRVTDETLLAKTGGIIQGMSGCPIVQNDKLVGAVTHVFVNDPTRGYGTIITHMLKQL